MEKEVSELSWPSETRRVVVTWSGCWIGGDGCSESPKWPTQGSISNIIATAASKYPHNRPSRVVTGIA